MNYNEQIESFLNGNRMQFKKEMIDLCLCRDGFNRYNEILLTAKDDFSVDTMVDIIKYMSL